MSKKNIKIILSLCVVVIFQLLNNNNVFAEVKDFNGCGEYTMGEYETIIIAKEHAIQEAERNALEQAGVYVKSYTKTKNLKVEEDTITVLTNGILWVKNKKISKSTTEHGDIHIKAEILVSIDTDDIEKKLKNEKTMEDMQNNYNDLQRKYNNLEKEIQQLRNSSSKEAANKISKEMDKRLKTQSELNEVQNSIKANRGRSLEERKTLYDNAINKINQLINEDPSYGELYLVRANMKKASEQLYKDGNPERIKESIDDYNIAEKLFINDNLKLAQIYDHRSAAYSYFDNYEKEIEDITKLIDIPESEKVYKNYALYLTRGRIYNDCRQYKKAVNDADMAFNLWNKLKNKSTYDYVFSTVYQIKSRAYEEMKKYNEAIECYTKLINYNENKEKSELGMDVFIGYISSRGECYLNINDYTNAKNDLDRCIDLIKEKSKPSVTDNNAFLVRGDISRELNNLKEAVQVYTDGINYFIISGVPINKKLYNYINKMDVYDKEVARWKLNTLALLYFERGRAHHDLGEYIEAINDYNEYMRIDPKNLFKNKAWAYINISRCYSMLGKKTEAMDYVNKALALEPGHKEALEDKRILNLLDY